jgi:hypothetical protein
VVVHVTFTADVTKQLNLIMVDVVVSFRLSCQFLSIQQFITSVTKQFNLIITNAVIRCGLSRQFVLPVVGRGLIIFAGIGIFHPQSGDTTYCRLETHSWVGSQKDSRDSSTAFRMSPSDHGHILVPTMQWNLQLAREIPQPLVGTGRG